VFTSVSSTCFSLQRETTELFQQSRGGVDPEPIQNGLPVLVSPLNNDMGIPKGDVLLSLLHDDDEQRTWSARVYEAVWRCRIVRRFCDTAWVRTQASPSRIRGRTSVQVDADDGRVVNGSVLEVQAAAMHHLKYDELEDALDLYHDILERYYTFSEDLHNRQEAGSKSSMRRLSEFRPFIGLALYNLGIVHMLRGEFQMACQIFDRAMTNRANHNHGGEHVDHLVRKKGLPYCSWSSNNLQLT